MASVRPRENTFKIDLTNFPKRPSFEDIHKFVHESLELTVDHVVRLQMNHAQNCVHIKCRDLQTAQTVVENHHAKHEIEVNKTKVKVRLAMDDGGTEVKFHDLSENIRNEELVEFLKQYGEVITIQDQVWSENYPLKGIPTGVRVVKIILRRHIKSFVTIQGEQTLVTYRNQVHTCKHCTNPSHPGSTCVENKKLLGQKVDLNNRLKAAAKSNNSQPASFASVVNQSASTLMPSFVALNKSSAPAPVSVAASSAASTSAPLLASDQPDGPAPPAGEIDQQMNSSNREKQRMEIAKQKIGEIARYTVIGETVADKQPFAGQSTQQAAVNDVATSSVRFFHIPSSHPDLNLPPNITMEISESDCGESSQDDESFQEVKRKGRSKNKKLTHFSNPKVTVSRTVSLEKSYY